MITAAAAIASAASQVAIPLGHIANKILDEPTAPGVEPAAQKLNMLPVLTPPQRVTDSSLASAITAARELSTSTQDAAIGVWQTTKGFDLLFMGEGFEPAQFSRPVGVAFEKSPQDNAKPLQAIVGSGGYARFGDATMAPVSWFGAETGGKS